MVAGGGKVLDKHVVVDRPGEGLQRHAEILRPSQIHNRLAAIAERRCGLEIGVVLVVEFGRAALRADRVIRAVHQGRADRVGQRLVERPSRSAARHDVGGRRDRVGQVDCFRSCRGRLRQRPGRSAARHNHGAGGNAGARDDLADRHGSRCHAVHGQGCARNRSVDDGVDHAVGGDILPRRKSTAGEAVHGQSVAADRAVEHRAADVCAHILHFAVAIVGIGQAIGTARPGPIAGVGAGLQRQVRGVGGRHGVGAVPRQAACAVARQNEREH